MVVRWKMYSPNSVNKFFPTQQNTKARSFSRTIFHMKTSPLLTNRKSPIPRVTEDIKISCSWNGVFVKLIALECQSKTLKVTSKFQSPKLNFQPHWRQAGRNFGAPKKYGRGGGSVIKFQGLRESSESLGSFFSRHPQTLATQSSQFLDLQISVPSLCNGPNIS